MRIALCISGYFTNKVNDNLSDTNYIHQNIIDKINKKNNTLDIFIHSFDTKSKDKILKKYPNVKKYIIEPQINFREKMSKENLSYENKLDSSIFPIPLHLNSQFSFLYSRKECIKLALNDDINYDLIIWCRFDICVRLKKSSSQINPSKLILPNLKMIDTEFLYMSNWDHMHSGYSDHWFFSSPKNMKILADMYDDLEKYYNLNSNFYKYATQLGIKYKNNGFFANIHTIHMFYLNTQKITKENIKLLSFFG